jgi:TonB family protein
MKEKGIRPLAKVRIVVSAEGDVMSTRVEVSSGYAEFDQNCIRAAQSTPFQPKIIDGVAMQDTVIQPYRVNLR